MKRTAWTGVAAILICFISSQAFAEEKTAELPVIDYDDVAEGKELEQNIMLQRGDLIVVP